MIKYKFFVKIVFYFLFYIIRKLKILTNENGITSTKFSSSLIKNIKHFNQEKKIKPWWILSKKIQFLYYIFIFIFFSLMIYYMLLLLFYM